MTALGMPPDIMEHFLNPEESTGGESASDGDVPTAYPDMLERNTELYFDCYMAVRVLGIRYSDYLLIPSAERLLYRLFLWMEGAKDRHTEVLRQSRRDATTEAIQQRPHPRAVRR